MGIRNRLAESLPVTFGWLDPADPPKTNGGPAPASTNGAAAAVETKSSLPFGHADFWPIDDAGNTIDADVLGVLTMRSAYTASVLAYAAMRYRATKLAEAPLTVFEWSDAGEEELPTHPLQPLFDHPNDDEDLADMLEALSIALDETGMALWVVDRDAGNRPGRITQYAGDEFAVHPTAKRIYGRFELNAIRGTAGTDGRPISLPPEDVVFFRLPNPRDRWRGLGPLQVVARQLGIESELLRAMVHAMPNAVVPGLTISFPEGVATTGTQVKEYTERLRTTYASARNHGKPFVVGDNATVSRNALGFEGLAGGDLYREIESAVCVAFQVRPEILAMMVGLENAPWSHMETAQRLAYDEGIIPQWRRIERSITRQLLRPMDDDVHHVVRFETSNIRHLREDAERDARRTVLLKNADITTRNERRVIAGLERVDDPDWDAPPWDEPKGAGRDLGGGGFGSDDDDADDDDDTEDTDDTEDEDGDDAGTKAIPGTSLWLAEFEINTKAAEPTWARETEKVLRTWNTTAGRLFRRWVKAGPEGRPSPESIARFIGAVADYLGDEGARMAEKTLGPLVRSTTMSAGQRVATRLGFGFDVVSAGLEKYAAEETAFLVSTMGESTGKAVAKTVQRSLESRTTLVDLRKTLERLPAFDRKRAQLVARTETTRATNGAQHRTAKEYQSATGRRMQKTWISSRDDRVRDEHADADDGDWYPIDHVFGMGLTEPGEPNCRCTLGYRIAPEDVT